ncbi:alpha-1,3-fucosyltransferase [Helicobacter saguini]|uniref:Alpha-1,3-fucosyltransferase n=1 Tax=Helicobacter saguini TaxID=1548018 RepID=A0A6L7D9P8_9HELI|nr:alpha-1,3-fucosyltransferase [Helicobacter saguini]MWV68613.1 alpha-1,3-fucosyltransferase [Helicobacter saguini]MWV71836.1 alpha-1,3-fucosyltransferase [Helicobacter saguini]
MKLRILDWHTQDTEQNFYENFYVKLLQDKFNVIYSKEPDFIIYGPYGYEHLRYDCVRIYATGENVRADFNAADYAIDFDCLEFEDRHFQINYALLRDDFKIIVNKHLSETKDIKFKTKFCGYMVSNVWHPFTDTREEVFKALNEYKKVDSGGKHANNIGFAIKNKIEWLKDYKFNLCFENSSYPGYLTEKLFDAFAAGCVPIYWGDTSLRLMDLDSKKDSKDIESSCVTGGVTHSSNKYIESRTLDSKNFKNLNYENNKVIKSSPQDSIKESTKDSNIEFKNTKYKNLKIDTKLPHISQDLIKYRINPKSFINAHDFPDIDSLIAEVKRIDNDKEAYLQMLKEPVFLNDINELKAHKEKLKAFLESIFSQSPKDAFRRGKGQWLWIKNENAKKILYFDKEMQKIQGLSTLLRYHKLAKFINDMIVYRLKPRDFIKKLRRFLSKTHSN